jgi:bifunctional DNA-binding transcriptional regulator/antitoxin component of YhaV-PrlF toxin-antitoxin module
MLFTKLKKMGNFYRILIPKDELSRLDLSENQKLFIDIIKKENPLKEMFGFAKTYKLSKSCSEIIKEARKESRVD